MSELERAIHLVLDNYLIAMKSTGPNSFVLNPAFARDIGDLRRALAATAERILS